MTAVEIANACTTATCQAFDQARVTKLDADGSRPPLPSGTAGAGGAGAAGGASGASGASGAAGSGLPACSSLPNPVYVVGSTAAQPFLATIAQTLAGQSGSQQMSIVYQGQGSCIGVDAVLNATAITGEATYWPSVSDDPTLSAHTCAIDTQGVSADLGISDVFATTCFDLPQGLPSNVGDSFGPVQVMVFVVPETSSQATISADAAFFVFGFGEGSGVSPWTDESYIFQRNSSSGTQNMIAAYLGVPAGQWRGKQHATTDTMRTDLLAAGASQDTAEKAIGILSSATADSLRGQIKELALQGVSQTCGYWPDSSPTASDKRDVRDGHYPIWGPLHLLARLNGSGSPVSALGEQLLGYLTGTAALPGGIDLLQLYASHGLIPLCAMGVKRQTDGGSLTPSTPQSPCGCRFDYLATGATTCSACTSSTECPSDHPNCSFGYCEQ